MCGPLWASGLLTITERYKRGYKTMHTYWDGVCTFRAATVIAVLILPLVTLIKPAFAIFFGITMGVQAFACGNIGIRMCTTANDRGVACVIAGALTYFTPGWALLVGIIVWVVVDGSEAIINLKNLFTAAISVCSSPCAFVTVIISSMVVSLPLMLSVLRRNALFSERILFENRRDNITFSGTTHKKNNATIPFFESAIAAEISALITFGIIVCARQENRIRIF